MRAALILPCLGLAASASAAAPMPDRREVGQALLAMMICVENEAPANCRPAPLRAVFTRLRCVPAGDGDFGGVVLCRYAGHIVRADGSRGPIGSDCVYLTRDTALHWRVAFYPDSEFCEP